MSISFTDLTTFNGTKIWEGVTLSKSDVPSVGAFNLAGVYNDFYLFDVDQWDIDANLEGVKIKKNCKIFRCQTFTSAIAGLAPFVSINMVSGLVYFLQDMDSETLEFETRAETPEWVSINANQK